MTVLDDLLALLPDNTAGEISAADMREIVTELWNYTVSVQAMVNTLVVTTVPTVQDGVAAATAAITDLDTRVTALENAP